MTEKFTISRQTCLDMRELLSDSIARYSNSDANSILESIVRSQKTGETVTFEDRECKVILAALACYTFRRELLAMIEAVLEKGY